MRYTDGRASNGHPTNPVFVNGRRVFCNRQGSGGSGHGALGRVVGRRKSR